MSRIFRVAPFSTLILVSWGFLLLGGLLDWSVSAQFGLLWRILIIPSYTVLLVATILVRPLGGWAVLPMAVLLMGLVDVILNLLWRKPTSRLDVDSV